VHHDSATPHRMRFIPQSRSLAERLGLVDSDERRTRAYSGHTPRQGQRNALTRTWRGEENRWWWWGGPEPEGRGKVSWLRKL
jgi:hypothetical protein